MMKVFFTASTTFDGDLKENNRRILSELKKKGCKIISGEQIVDEASLDIDATLPKKKIFEREVRSIDEADFVVAEVTKPSHGVGGEITYALMNKKPVLSLVFKENEEELSPMIAGNPSVNLYLEHYTFNNLHLIINNFISHVALIKARKGKLIVIDGADGSGKSTQAHLLVEFLQKKAVPVRYIHFPRYYNSFHGKTVAKFLRGEFGSIDEVSPYLASLAYALDRASMKEEMDEYLALGGIIVTDRYATSNMAHQGAKFTDIKSQDEYLKWEYELEYKVHKLPKEDLVVYLSIPPEVKAKLTANRRPQKYLLGKKDIHEEDKDYQKRTQALYLKLAKENNWIVVECTKENSLLPPEEIHKLIVKKLSEAKIRYLTI